MHGYYWHTLYMQIDQLPTLNVPNILLSATFIQTVYAHLDNSMTVIQPVTRTASITLYNTTSEREAERETRCCHVSKCVLSVASV